jgi:hypothetical protein
MAAQTIIMLASSSATTGRYHGSQTVTMLVSSSATTGRYHGSQTVIMLASSSATTGRYHGSQTVIMLARLAMMASFRRRLLPVEIVDEIFHPKLLFAIIVELHAQVFLMEQ